MVIKGAQLGRRIDLGENAVEIGRSEECAISIDSELVSRRHAIVQRIAERYTIADLKSTNGTFVNGERVSAHALQDGDKISVGKTVLKYTESNVELQYHEQLHQMVRIDPLTGAYNKRYFDESLAHALSRHPTFSLVLLDVDHFKKINDTHGHAAGDHVLKRVCEAVRQALRGGESLARIGGEEFAFLVPGASRDAARERAEEARQLVESGEFAFADKPIAVTVSLGVAEHSDPNESAAELYHRADSLLYEAKRSGRNRVC